MAGTAVGGAGLFLALTAEPGTSPYNGLPNDFDRKVAGATLIATSVVVLASVVYGYSVASQCEQDKAAFARMRVARDAITAQRDRAWSLTRDAASAARADDCARVATLDAQVRATDAEFHRVVFRRDVAITRCLSAH